jgi:hypothetical protein
MAEAHIYHEDIWYQKQYLRVRVHDSHLKIGMKLNPEIPVPVCEVYLREWKLSNTFVVCNKSSHGHKFSENHKKRTFSKELVIFSLESRTQRKEIFEYVNIRNILLGMNCSHFIYHIVAN